MDQVMGKPPQEMPDRTGCWLGSIDGKGINGNATYVYTAELDDYGKTLSIHNNEDADAIELYRKAKPSIASGL